jgi:hypothetical protein
MKRTSIPHLVLAATLAVLLPLQQLHCACMESQGHAAPVAASSGHECCESTPQCGAEHHSQPERAPHSCTCAQIAVVALPPVIEASVVAAPTVAPLAVLTVPAVIAPVSIVTETVPALDVGSSRLPVDPGAHGLRAPPVSA